MNSSTRSLLNNIGREEEQGDGVDFLDSMEQRCYPSSHAPRDLDYIPDGQRVRRERPINSSHLYSRPNEMVKHRERERMTGYHASPHYSTSPAAGGDSLIKYLERERMMIGGGGGGYTHLTSPSCYQQQSFCTGSREDGPVTDIQHDDRGDERYNEPYGDTRGYHDHHQNYHQNRYEDREDAIQKKKAAFNAGRATHEKMIEVAPGFQMRLRGADETWAAVERDFFGPATCFSCQMTVFCILDAEYVLCPTCKVIFPFEQDGEVSEKSKKGAGGGVGLGFSMEDLARFQSDIVSRYS